MSEIEDLERELSNYWKKTKEERKNTHTKVLYNKMLKRKEMK